MNEFTELENRIQSRSNGPSSALRDRILRAVDSELAVQRPDWQAPVWLWAAAAALITIVLNLSFASATANGFALSGPTTDQMAAEIQALAAVDATNFPSTAAPTRAANTEIVQ